MAFPAPINSLLARCIQAYRAGAAAPVTMSDGPSGELFRSRAQAHIRSRLTDAQLEQYVAVRDLSRAAVASARGGRFDESRTQFAEAERALASFNTIDEVRHLSRSWIDQAYAYLSVRERDWATARARLASAMQADLALEDDFDYEIFHIGRVHTLHLWLRAEGEAGNRAGAIAIAQEMLDYLHGGRDDVSVGSGWSRERAAGVPDDLRLAMTLRVCSEIGTQVALCDGERAAAAFAAFRSWRGWADHPVLSEVHDWAAAKEAWLAGRTREFLERAMPILLRGRRETTLWYAVAFDVVAVCAAMRPEATAPFCDDVRSDVAQWRQLPPDVQAPGLFAAMAGGGQRVPYAHRQTAKRFHAFTVGLPRTGSTSLSALFANFRSGNEFMERDTIEQAVGLATGAVSRPEFEAFLRRRSIEGDLEMDSASFHHLYLDFLCAEYPGAAFVMTIRSPYDWANSYIKMIAGWRQRFIAEGEPLPQWMEDYGVMLFGDFSWDWVASPASIAERAEALADAFIRHWAEANRRTLSLLPSRSLVIRTEELSTSVERLARFVGVPLTALTDRHHVNAHPDRSDLLRGLGRAWVEARAREYGADVLAATRISLETVSVYPERAEASRRA